MATNAMQIPPSLRNVLKSVNGKSLNRCWKSGSENLKCNQQRTEKNEVNRVEDQEFDSLNN